MPGPAVDRDAIKNALLALIASATFASSINGASTWVSVASRRLKMFTQVDKTEQPAAFLVEHRETYDITGVGQLQKRYMNMGIWCYAPTGDSGIIGDSLLDTMESAIENALVPDEISRNELTLGGLVYWCRIRRNDNLFIRDPGDIDGQALLILPVQILIP